MPRALNHGSNLTFLIKMLLSVAATIKSGKMSRYGAWTWRFDAKKPERRIKEICSIFFERVLNAPF